MTRCFFPVIISLTLSVSCSTESIQEPTSEHKEAIIKEIKTLWESGQKGFEDLDVEPLFSYFSKSDNAKIITYGTLYTDIDALKKQFTAWFESPNAFRQKATFDTTYFDFINDKAVLMSTVGTFVILNDTISNNQPVKRAYTLLWIKEHEGWKALNMHISQ